MKTQMKYFPQIINHRVHSQHGFGQSGLDVTVTEKYCDVQYTVSSQLQIPDDPVLDLFVLNRYYYQV